jgi:hypothetical protein
MPTQRQEGMVMFTYRYHLVFIWFLLLAAVIRAGHAAPLPTLDCHDPRAAPAHQPNAYYDGFFIGRNGCFYDPSRIDIQDVPPVLGTLGDQKLRLWQVNGANASPLKAYIQMHEIVQVVNLPILGIYNASDEQGAASDLAEAYVQKHTPAINSIVTQIQLALDRQEEVFIRSGSQGTLLLSEALKQIRAHYERATLTNIRLKQIMQRIMIETHGGVAHGYPDGPRYVHYANLLDAAVQSLGVLSPGSHPGASAVIVTFSGRAEPSEAKYQSLSPAWKLFLSTHGQTVYLAHRVPFAQAYSHANPQGPVTTVSYNQLKR